MSLSNPILGILGEKVGILVLGSYCLVWCVNQSFKGKIPNELEVPCSWSKLYCSVINTFCAWYRLTFLFLDLAAGSEKLPCVFWYDDDQANSTHW